MPAESVGGGWWRERVSEGILYTFADNAMRRRERVISDDDDGVEEEEEEEQSR